MARFLDSTGLSYFWEKIKAWIPFLSRKTQSIPFGQVDSTSTSTAFTASIDGIDELRDGVCCYIRNDAISSSSNFTLNVNGLGAKPVYSNAEDAGRVSTAWTAEKTFLFVYNSSRVSGGCWDAYYGNSSVDESNLVHKTGAETIAGIKSFTNDVRVVDSSLVIDSNSQNKHSVYMNIGNYYDDGHDGIAVLALDDPTGQGDVILRYVSDPLIGDDAANKNYVDGAILTNDATVVHKAGAETITGEKTFRANMNLTGGSVLNLVYDSQTQDGVYLEATELNGIRTVSFSGISDDGVVRISNVGTPVYSNDAVNKDYLLSLISNATKYYFFLFRNYQIGSHEIGNTGIDIQSLTFAGNELNQGTYKVTLLRHIWYDGINISGDSDINVLVYFQKKGSTTKTYISGGTYIMHMITSPNDQRNRMGSVVVNLVGFITLAEAPALNDIICIQIDGHAGLVLGGEQPIAGSSIESVDDNDFVLFEKINMTGTL